MPKVEKMDSNSQSPGIYQRLIKFILGKLRRHSELPSSNQVPVEERSLRNGKDNIRPINRPNDLSDPDEIAVDFRHIGGWSRTNRGGDSILAGTVLGNDQTRVYNGLDEKERNKDDLAPRIDPDTGTQGQGKSLQEVQAVSGRGKGLKKSFSIKESEEKKLQANHSADDQSKMANNQPHEDKKPRPPRHLLSVASNINEKSDAYIERVRAAMSRNYSLDPEKS